MAISCKRQATLLSGPGPSPTSAFSAWRGIYIHMYLPAYIYHSLPRSLKRPVRTLTSTIGRPAARSLALRRPGFGALVSFAVGSRLRDAPLWLPYPTCWIGIHVFLGRSHTNMNNVFRPVNPVLDRNMCIFKVAVFINRDKSEYNTVFYASLRIFNM